MLPCIGRPSNHPAANIYPEPTDLPIGPPAKFFGGRLAPAPDEFDARHDNKGLDRAGCGVLCAYI